MEQDEEMKVKTLMERFQNDEISKIRIKPAIPDKPKTILPISPTAKISNPLIASINSAVENRMAPRVVFKDDKKNRKFSQPETSIVKAKPVLLNKNQKKEADLIKQALKDKTILRMSPVTPVLEQTPKPESIQQSPVLETPVKLSTPLKKSIFNKTDNNETEKTCPSEWGVPATPVLGHSDSSISTPAKAEVTDNKPVVPKALVLPFRTNNTFSAPVISPPAVSVSKPPGLTVPEPVSQNVPQMVNPRPEIPIRLNSNVISPTANLFPHGLPEEATSSSEINDILDMDIPPPIIPEDFSDGGTSALNISASVTPEHSFPEASLLLTPVSSRPALSRTASPIPAIKTPDSDSAFIFSPLPAFLAPSTNVESMAEKTVTESHKTNDHTEKPLEVPLSSSPKTPLVVSALARAEEMAPVKHNSCDKRLLTLLEKAKQKSTKGDQLSIPEILPLVESDLPSNAPLESALPETANAEPFSHVDAPEMFGNILDIPPVDYEGKAEGAALSEYDTQPYETALNDQDYRKSSPTPKVVVVQRAVVPPPPPPRKPQSTLFNGGLTPEKPPQSPSTDMQSTILPSQPLKDNGIIIPAPADFTSEYSKYEDSDICDPSEMIGSHAEAPDYGNPGPLVHEEPVLEHLNLKHQIPNMDTTDAGLPKTVMIKPSDSPDSPFNPILPSPSGKQINYSSTELEDLAISKKSKATKKQRKGSPMNPYADGSVAEIPKKTLFSKKNSVSDGKELKSKEKQKQKDKEKEKEKEKKEQKEKEKDKEQKEKEKEKELKEKEKEKNEQKDKKKEQKEKERNKKELKEKEREKKEQKEKEKKVNEIKKKFKITVEEEALYQTKVKETTKGRKDDLALKAGEIVSIIRTTDCPKGKWLARDSNNKYGYIPVESVELNIQEMMVLGNKSKATNRTSVNGIIDPEAPSTDMISSHHYSLNQESFEDDSEEWIDDDDTVFPTADATDLDVNRWAASPDISPEPGPALPTHTDSSNTFHTGHEALHKLTTFFAQPQVHLLQTNTPIKEPQPLAISAEEPVSSLKQETDLQILPPPDLYADIVMG